MKSQMRNGIEHHGNGTDIFGDVIIPCLARHEFELQVRHGIMKMNKEAINRAYDMCGLTGNLEYGAEMFALTSMAQSPEGAEFRRIAREQGLKAAIRWRDAQFS